MSGDVQPRKRRDKKRKKDESSQGDDPVIQHQTSASGNDDFNIHVHKESSTGGGICAKIVFFFLFAILGVLIGLIIIEHRGLTDLDTVDTESRYAKVFDGWTEPPGHDDHDDERHTVVHVHHDEHDEDEGHSQEMLEEDEEEEASEEETYEVELSEEAEDEEETEEAQEDTDEEEASEEGENEDTTEANLSEDEDEGDNLTDEEDDETVEKYGTSKADDEDSEYETEDVGNDSENASLEEEEEDSAAATDDDDEEEDGDANDLDNENVSKIDESTKEQIEADDDEDDEEQVEQLLSKEMQSAEISQEVEEQHDKSNDDESAAGTENNIENAVEKGSDDAEENDADAAEETEQETVNVAVKFGVGVALLVVAHVVLVRKWNPDTNRTDTAASHLEGVSADLSRRKTIVVPPTLEQVEQHIENLDAEYSEEDYNGDCPDESEDEEDVNAQKNLESKFEPVIAKQQYTELRTTYTRSLTPESDPGEEDEEEVEVDEDEEEEEDTNVQLSDVKKYNYVIEDDDEADGEEEEIEDEEEEEEISDNDDEDLLKKLEAKYGKIVDEDSDEDNQFVSWKKVKVLPKEDAEESDSEEEAPVKEESKAGGNSVNYANENITNSEDWVIKDELDFAQDELQNNEVNALALFNTILKRYPKSPRAIFGKAKALDISAESKQSNELLFEAINEYGRVLALDKVPNQLFKIAAERCINRMRFRGQYGRAIEIHKLLINRFPNAPEYPNQLAVTYLTINKLPEAKHILHETLLKWRTNGFAQVHYGFVLKVFDNDIDNAIGFMKQGIGSKEPGVIDGRFFFHLGDALMRKGRKAEAMKVYEDGVVNKVFPSVYQRSLYNVARLTAKPWWNINETPFATFFEKLRRNWVQIRNEGLALLNEKGFFKDESENLKEMGEWKQYELFARGNKFVENCKKCPVTCKIIETQADARGCRRGQSKFSVMHPGTHIWPHCGPTNCRLRSHLGLKVPKGTFIRVADETKTWHEGEVFLFDDSFEHEVWHNGSEARLVLIVDIWHPELTATEKGNLPAI